VTPAWFATDVVVTVDADAEAVYVQLRDDLEVASTVAVAPNLNVDVSASGLLVGVELLGLVPAVARL